MKKLLLTLGAVASVAAPVAAVVACSSDDSTANDKAINLSVKAGVQPDLTKLPTTSWFSTDDWDRNLFLFEKQSKALEDVLEATGTTLTIANEENLELKGLKEVLLDIVSQANDHSDDLYKGISTGFKVNPGGTNTADILPANSIELMVHDGPYESKDQAKTALASPVADRGFTHPKNVIFEILYIPTDEIGTFLDNLDKKVQAFVDHDAIKLSDDEKKVWNVIYKESKRAI